MYISYWSPDLLSTEDDVPLDVVMPSNTQRISISFTLSSGGDSSCNPGDRLEYCCSISSD